MAGKRTRVFAIWHEPVTAQPEPYGSPAIAWRVYTFVEGGEYKLYRFAPMMYKNPFSSEIVRRKTTFSVPPSAKIISVPSKWNVFIGLPENGIDIPKSSTWHWRVNHHRAWLVHSQSGLALCVINRGDKTAPREVKAAWAAMIMAS